MPPEAAATQALYERYARRVYTFCLHRLGSREEAEDAVQSTFLNAFRGFKRGVVPRAESAWLFKIAENVCLSRRRSTWRRGAVERPSDLQAHQDVLPAPQAENDQLIPLGDALIRMPDNQRRAILLREWQGLSYREIADELGVSQSAVETLLFRARRSLARRLERPEDDQARRRRVGALDAGSLAAALKGLLTGGTIVKAIAVATVVTGATIAATAPSGPRADRPAKVEPKSGTPRATHGQVSGSAATARPGEGPLAGAAVDGARTGPGGDAEAAPPNGRGEQAEATEGPESQPPGAPKTDRSAKALPPQANGRPAAPPRKPAKPKPRPAKPPRPATPPVASPSAPKPEPPKPPEATGLPPHPAPAPPSAGPPGQPPPNPQPGQGKAK
jgi:RNA polymerase sigma factor (sigma-70 family)